MAERISNKLLKKQKQEFLKCLPKEIKIYGQDSQLTIANYSGFNSCLKEIKSNVEKL